jgi:hypothetical protein
VEKKTQLERGERILKARIRLTAQLSTALFCAATPLAAEDTCGLEKIVAPESLVLAIDSMRAGDFVAFVGALEPEGRSPPENSLKLASELESYSSEGFDKCVLAAEDIGPNAQSLFFVFKDGEQDERVVYVFVMLVRFEDSWQFIKTQVSTNFDEVYQFVR